MLPLLFIIIIIFYTCSSTAVLCHLQSGSVKINKRSCPFAYLFGYLLKVNLSEFSMKKQTDGRAGQRPMAAGQFLQRCVYIIQSNT